MTFHIALSSIPQSRDKDGLLPARQTEGRSFMEVIAESYAILKRTIHDYYRSVDTGDTLGGEQVKEDFVYLPAKYYLLGTYDAAFITLVDRFKFSQRLIVPSSDGTSSDFSYFTNSFQIISGITITNILEKNDQLSLLFNNGTTTDTPPAFLSVCNIKLNNSLLIGNGNDFLQAVKKIIVEFSDEIFGSDKLTFLLQSFSWFEITLLMFTDEVEKVGQLLFKLRKLRIEQLGISDAQNLADSSLYRNLPKPFTEQPKEKVLNSHVIIDTHTYIGIHADYIEKDYLFQKILNKQYQTIASEIEWHVKPGHLPGLLKIIEEEEDLSSSFNVKDISLLIGKSDYLISNTDVNSFLDNLKVFRLLIRSNSLFDHIRKMKTRVFFRIIDLDKKDDPTQPLDLGITRFVSELNHLAISHKTIAIINQVLKSLKVSRQVRSKVVKTFHNYNNVIQNSVLYTFFLDLGHFAFNLILTIYAYNEKFNKSKAGHCVNDNESIHEIESNLIDLIDIFQEGYNIRVLNCYEYEEITDFDLDFNSSIEQLLTTYNSIVICLGENIYKRNSQKTVYAPIVRLNLKNTVSNYDSINYSVYNFLAPEFIFFTVLKEVLNHFTHNQSEAKEEIDEVKSRFYKAIQENRYLMDFLETDSIDFDYYYIDAIRYIMVCNHDFKLFYYWFWTTNFQNASLYDTIGVMKEKHFKTEIFRIMFLAKLFGEEVCEDQCPIPTLENYWERYYRITQQSITHLFENKSLVVRFRSLIYDEIGECISKFPVIPEQVIKIEGDSFLDLLRNNISLLKEAFPETEVVVSQGIRQDKLHTTFIPYYTRYLDEFFHQHKDRIKEGKTPGFTGKLPSEGQLFLYGLMYSYLRLLYEMNNTVINFLYRSWGNGKPMHSFINVSSKDALYFIDQTGSIFFIREDKANQYFTMRNGVLLSLMDFADKYKIHLFSDIVKRSQIIKRWPVTMPE